MASIKDIKLCTMIALTLAYFLVQIIMSHITHSLTLLTDSYHMLYNILSLLCCLISIKMSREKTLRNTFGWARIEVLGMLASILFLAALYFSIIVEALQTIVHASHQDEKDAMHHPLVVLIIAGIGIVLNIVCFILLGGYTHEQGCFLLVQGEDVKVSVVIRQDESLRKRKLTLRKENKSEEMQSGLFRCHLVLDFFRDISGCLMVMVCCCIVYYFEGDIARYADPILSIISVFILLVTSYPFIKQSGMILLQNIPDSIDVSGLKQRLLQKFPEVLNVHDLHVWRLTRNKIIATCHIICMSPRDYKNITQHLDDFFQQEGITLSTIQPEFMQYDTGDQVKNINCILCCGKQESTCNAKRCCGEMQNMKQTTCGSNELTLRSQPIVSVVSELPGENEKLLQNNESNSQTPTTITLNEENPKACVDNVISLNSMPVEVKE